MKSFRCSCLTKSFSTSWTGSNASSSALGPIVVSFPTTSTNSPSASSLAAVSVLPEFLLTGINVAGIPGIGASLDAVLPAWITQGMGINFYFGGTSLLIVVGVAMDTVQQIESQLVMRNYDGFLKKGRIRGRR